MANVATDTTSINVTTMQCRNCRATWETSLNFCGRCGQRLRGSTATVQLEPSLAIPFIPSLVDKEKGRTTNRGLRRVVYILSAVLLCGILFTSLFALFSYAKPRPTGKQSPPKTAVPVITRVPQGAVWFNDVYAQGDGVTMQLSNLPPLTHGHAYAGWLFSPYRPDQLFALGSLTPAKNGAVFFESSQMPTFNPGRQNLRLMYTRVAVTLESATSAMQRPVGPMILQGMMRVQALDTVTQLFVNTTYLPGKASLVAGMRSQMRELARWVANMLDSVQRGDSGSVDADLLRLVYVIEGNKGVDSASLHVLTMPNIQYEGDGFGLLSSAPNCQIAQLTCGYFDAVRNTLQSLVALNAVPTQDVQAALTTINTAEQATETVLQHALHLVGVTTLDTATRSSLTLLSTQSDTLLNGADRDGDGRIDPVPGEASVAQLYTYLQSVATIKLS